MRRMERPIKKAEKNLEEEVENCAGMLRYRGPNLLAFCILYPRLEIGTELTNLV
jgi:hypothetical protein